MWRVRDFKFIAGEHVVTHHKPLFFVEEEREDNVVGKNH